LHCVRYGLSEKVFIGQLPLRVGYRRSLIPWGGSFQPLADFRLYGAKSKTALIPKPFKTNSYDTLAPLLITGSGLFGHLMLCPIPPPPSHKPTIPQKTDACKAWTNRPPATACAVRGSCPRSCGECQTKNQSRLGGCCASR
jgi:hypothetical protein